MQHYKMGIEREREGKNQTKKMIASICNEKKERKKN
jgi:hypothetical protein